MTQSVRSMNVRFPLNDAVGRLAAFAATMTLAPAGCKTQDAGPACNPDDEAFESVRVLVQPDEMLNPNEDGEPLSVQLHIYQLSGDESVEMIDFETVWEQGGEAAFGDDFVAEEEITVYPGRADMLELTPDPQTRFIVAAAIFREPLGQDWFRVYEVPRYHGHSVCAAKRRGQRWPNPCFHVLLERYLVDGGHTPPAGWNPNSQTQQCPGPPMKTPPVEPIEGKKIKKRKRKKLKDAELPTAPEPPAAPAAPEPPVVSSPL